MKKCYKKNTLIFIGVVVLYFVYFKIISLYYANKANDLLDPGQRSLKCSLISLPPFSVNLFGNLDQENIDRIKARLKIEGLNSFENEVLKLTIFVSDGNFIVRFK